MGPKKKIKKMPVKVQPENSTPPSSQSYPAVFTPSDDGRVLSQSSPIGIDTNQNSIVDSSQLPSNSAFSNSTDIGRIVDKMIDVNEDLDQLSISQHSSRSIENQLMSRGQSLLSTPSSSPRSNDEQSETPFKRPSKTLMSFPREDDGDNGDDTNRYCDQTSTELIVDPNSTEATNARKSKSKGVSKSTSSKRTSERRRVQKPNITTNNITADSPVEQSQVNATDTDNDNLFKRVLRGKTAPKSLVQDWMEDYGIDKKNAILILKNFFIRSCGSQFNITSEMDSTMNTDQILQHLDDYYTDHNKDLYPLKNSGSEWRKFPLNFGEFVSVLVGQQYQNSIILDSFFADHIFEFLQGLSRSTVRSFRHTSTYAVLKIITGVVKLTMQVSMDLDTAKEQLKTEHERGNRASSERTETLIVRVRDLEAILSELGLFKTYAHNAILNKRYVDIASDIRSMCISELGVWMKLVSQEFMVDVYLRYIGWALYDDYASIRLCALEVLFPLYALGDKNPEIGNQLQLFTNKYKDRVIHMTVDEELEVAVTAVKLISAMHRLYRDQQESFLTDSKYQALYMLLFSSRRSVALAGGEFVIQMFFPVSPENSFESFQWLSGKQGNGHTHSFRDLVDFFIEADLPDHSLHLVDSLIEIHPMLVDWECMTDLLLEEPKPRSSTEEDSLRLDSKQEEALIKLMVAAIRLSVTNETPSGRLPAKKAPSASDKKRLAGVKCVVSEHFIPLLPALLSKFANAPLALVNLLSIPLYFDFGIYTKSRHLKSLKSLLEAIKVIQEATVDTDVLENAAKTMEVIGYDLQEERSATQVKLSAILDAIWKNAEDGLVETETASQTENGQNKDTNENLIASLRRIATTIPNLSFEKYDIWYRIFRIVRKTCTGSRSFPMKAVKYAITSCFYSLLWNLKSVTEIVEEGTVATEEVAKLNRKLNDFMTAMKFILSRETFCRQYGEDAFKSVCDLLPIFSSHSTLTSEKQMENLRYEADEELSSSLQYFLTENVFSMAEDGHGHAEELEDADVSSSIENKRSMLAQYVKLFMLKVIPVQAADVLIKFYSQFYSSLGDIIKVALTKAVEVDDAEFALVLIRILQGLFDNLNQNNLQYDRSLNEIRELARILSMSFVPITGKVRKVINKLHHEGILFALKEGEGVEAGTEELPQNVEFLDILIEFSLKLSKDGKTKMLQHLTDTLTTFVESPDLENEKWLPFIAYRDSLDVNHPSSTIPLQRRTPKKSIKPAINAGTGSGTKGISRGRKRPATASSSK